MKVEVVRAWPRRFEAVALDLPAGADVRDAVTAAGFMGDDEVIAYAIFGVRAELDTTLIDGDRVECLRALQADPKDARRRRADAKKPQPKR